MNKLHKVVLVGAQRSGTSVAAERIYNSNVFRNKPNRVFGGEIFSNQKVGKFTLEQNGNILTTIISPIIIENKDNLHNWSTKNFNILLNGNDNCAVIMKIMIHNMSYNQYIDIFAECIKHNFTIVHINRKKIFDVVLSYIRSSKINQWSAYNEILPIIKLKITDDDINNIKEFLLQYKIQKDAVYCVKKLLPETILDVSYESLQNDLNSIGFTCDVSNTHCDVIYRTIYDDFYQDNTFFKLKQLIDLFSELVSLNLPYADFFTRIKEISG